jgi:hypothetical protein
MALTFGVAPKAASLHKKLVDAFPLLREKAMVEPN